MNTKYEMDGESWVSRYKIRVSDTSYSDVAKGNRRSHTIHIFQTCIFMYKYSHNQLLSLFYNIYSVNSNIHTYPTRCSTNYHLENPKIFLAQSQ